MGFEKLALTTVATVIGERRRASFMNGSMYVMTDLPTAQRIVQVLHTMVSCPVQMRPATDPPGNIYIFDFNSNG